MSSMLQEYEEYDRLKDTPEGRAILAEVNPSAAWKPLPTAPIAPPMRTGLLPPVLRSMAEAVAASLNVPPDLPALVGLGVASACACGRIAVEAGINWQEIVSLFFVGVMPSGAKKTPVFNTLACGLFDWQEAENRSRKRRIEADKAEMEVMQANKARAIKSGNTVEARQIAEQIAGFPLTHKMRRFIGGNATPESMIQIMAENEGATAQLDDEGTLYELLAGRYQDVPDLNPWITGYTGKKPLSSDRKGGSETVDRPAVSVLTLTQPYVFEQVLDNPRMGGEGFVARFLISCPEPLREWNEGVPIPEAVDRGYKAAVRRLLVLKPATLTLTAEAKRLFNEWRRELFELGWGEWNQLQQRGFVSKYEGATVRLAAILHLWEEQDTEEAIDATTMRNAIALIHYFAGHTLHLLGTQGGFTAPAKEALTLLVKAGDPTQREREIKQALSKRRMFPSGEAVDAALGELERAGYIRRTIEKGAGRPVALVELHPDLLPQREAIEI